MSAEIVYDFEWDAAKARTNLRKHGVSFRAATAVFRDPLARTIFDDEHSEDEERWVTLGRAENGKYLVVVHTFAQVSETESISGSSRRVRPTARKYRIMNERRASG